MAHSENNLFSDSDNKYRKLLEEATKVREQMANTDVSINPAAAWEMAFDKVNDLPFCDPFKSSEVTDVIDSGYEDEFSSLYSNLGSLIRSLEELLETN